VLQNLSNSFTSPCILDLKLGAILYDRDATEEKRLKMEKAAKRGTSFDTGIRMTGFQVGIVSLLLFRSCVNPHFALQMILELGRNERKDDQYA
jgi:hypothetical protein